MTTTSVHFQQLESASIPLRGASMEQVEAMIQKNMEADIPVGQDLGRFSTSMFDPETDRLIAKSILKNQASVEENPSLSRFQRSCVAILAHLWNIPSNATFLGTATTGSSEAALLGGLSMKRNWQKKHPNGSTRPNVLIGDNAHICLKKFAEYFDVEIRPLRLGRRYAVESENLENQLDENTIGVFLTLGSTYTGHFDPIEQIAKILDRYEDRTGNDIPIHVDAASGGFVAPFAPSNKNSVWDFRLPRVRSINASGHKFGLVPLAVGWIVWRDVSYVPEDLVFESSYLRGTHKAFTLSFSRSGYPIVFQYHNFLHLGMEGYRDRVRTSLTMARRLSNWLEATGYFHCLSDIHRCYAHLKTDCDVCEWRTGREVHPGLPMVVFSFSETTRREHPSLSLAALSNAMLDSRFSIPNYVLPMRSTNSKRLDVMRIVIRTEFDDDLLQRVLTAIVDHIERLIEENTAIPDDGHDQLYPKMSKNILD